MRTDLLYEATRADEIQQVQVLTALRRDWLQLTRVSYSWDMDDDVSCRDKDAEHTACVKT